MPKLPPRPPGLFDPEALLARIDACGPRPMDADLTRDCLRLCADADVADMLGDVADAFRDLFGTDRGAVVVVLRDAARRLREKGIVTR